jgi:hypothetical protein
VIGAVILIPLSELLQAHLGAVIPGIHGVIYGAVVVIGQEMARCSEVRHSGKSTASRH